jgi:hypothetical protein
MDPWVNLLMSNKPFGRFDRLVSFGPPVFLYLGQDVSKTLSAQRPPRSPTP